VNHRVKACSLEWFQIGSKGEMNMNNIAENIKTMINERGAEICKLVSDVKNAIGESGRVEVDSNGVTYILTADKETVSVKRSVKSTDYEWCIAMAWAPTSAFAYKCSADRAWNGESTDAETLKELKRLFDDEAVAMGTIRKVLDAYKSSNDAVTDFFGTA
jgi:hypothetical protein